MPNLKLNDDTLVKEIISLVSEICLSEQFTALCNELEVYYSSAGYPNPKADAFKDALFSMMQEVPDSWKPVNVPTSRLLDFQP